MPSFNNLNVEFLVNAVYNNYKFSHWVECHDEGLVIKMERNLYEVKNERRSFMSSSAKEGMESIKSKLDFLSNEQNAPFMTSFFIELIGGIKNTLGSIRNYTQISRGKFSDKEFGEYFYRAVTEDIEKIDMVLNGLINYIKLNAPIRKTNHLSSPPY